MEVPFGKPTEGLITPVEYDQLKFYTDPSSLGEVKQMTAYYQILSKREKVEVVTRLGKQCLLSPCLYGIGGGVIGGTLGSLAGFLYINMPGVAPGGWVGAKIGGALGFTAGFLKGGYNFKVQFLTSPKYNDWISQIREQNLYPIYKKIFQGDDRFEKFINKDTEELICVPVRAPDGLIYEQSSIIKWIGIVEENIKKAKARGEGEDKIRELRKTVSYHRVIAFTAEDLQYHPRYFQELAFLVQQKLSEIEDAEVKRLFTIGMQILKETHEENRKMILDGQIGQITQFVLKNNIPQKIADEACLLLMREYA